MVAETPSTAQHGDLPFTLAVEGFSDGYFVVVSFTARERLSGGYACDIVALTDGHPEEDRAPSAVPGRRAVFTLHADGQARAFHGIIAKARVDGVGPHGTIRYRLRVVPRLWL